jgi:hypothetical protein
MSSIRRHWRLLTVAVCCVALGAGVSAIATAGAATSTTPKSAAKGKAAKGVKGAKGAKAKRGALRRVARAVQGSAVVRTRNGFATLSLERGKVDSVSGQRLTITEGTPKATYKTVTVAVPANAVVRDDRRKAALSDVRTGQRVLVLQAPKRTYVIARTPRTL